MTPDGGRHGDSMSGRTYRQRLDADIARWQANGVITPEIAESMRGTLPPLTEGVTIATVVGIVGGLLIAAGVLAFVAANWTMIARPVRFAVLIAGIACAYAIGALFDRSGRPILSDLSAGVGSIVFGAAIALTGQMYHLGEDFAGGMLLFAAGALAAAVLTSSRGALAVALAAACIWNSMRVLELGTVHLPFVGFWLIAAALTVAWNAPSARHLVSLAAVSWLISTGFGLDQSHYAAPLFAVSTGFALLLGGGLAMAGSRSATLGAFGLTVSNYGAFALALTLAGIIAASSDSRGGVPVPMLACAIAAAVLPLVAAIVGRRLGSALAAASIALALIVVSGRWRSSGLDEPWLFFALELTSMLCLVISGMLDEERPRVVAGWIGLALGIAAITWAVRGSLLMRAVFLAAAGLVVIAIASLLGRLLRREQRP
jgi:uncharacterized membrane protein